MNLRSLPVALSAMLCGVAHPQSTFQRWVLPGQVEIEPGWVVQPWGSIQQLCPGPNGSIYGFDNESNDVASMNLASVYHIDAAGALVHGKNWVFFDDLGLDTILIHAMAPTPDGGILIAGTSYHAQPMYQHDLFTFKVDGAGEANIYGVAPGDFVIPRQLIPTTDGAIILLADAFQGSLVAKLDGSGNMLWNIIREDVTPISNFGCATSDGGAVVAGSDRIHVISTTGVITGMYSTSGIGFQPAVERIQNEGYALGSAVTAGNTVVASVAMVDTNMEVLWGRRFQLPLVQSNSDGYFCRLLALNDGTMLAWFPISSGTVLAHLDTNGNVLDARSVQAYIYTASLTSDGRIALGGYGGDGNLIVCDSTLSIGCSTAISLNTDPLTITISPTSFPFTPASFNYTLEHPGTSAQDNLMLSTACISTGIQVLPAATAFTAGVDVNGDLLIDDPMSGSRTFQRFILSDMLGRVRMAQDHGPLPLRRSTAQIPPGVYAYSIDLSDGASRRGNLLIE